MGRSNINSHFLHVRIKQTCFGVQLVQTLGVLVSISLDNVEDESLVVWLHGVPK